MSYKEVYFDLCQGMCLIEGWNYDENSSNGAGKSVLMDLVSYCLFDEIPRDLKVDEVINDQEGKGCELEVAFKLNGVTYQVFKKRKPNDAYIIKDGLELPRGKDLKETREQIQNLIKFDYRTFTNSIYLAPGGKSEFISLSDTEKQKILTEVLDLTIFDDAYKAVSQKIKELDSQYSLTQSQLGQCQSRAVELNSEIAQLQVRSNNFQKEIHTAIKQKRDQQNHLANEIKQLQAKIELSSSVVFDEVPPLILEADYVQIESINQKLQMQGQVDALVSSLGQKSYLLQNEVNNLSAKKRKFSALKEGDCSECGQPITGDHLQKEIDKVNVELVAKNDEWTKAQAEYQQYKLVQDKFRELQSQKQMIEANIHKKQLQHQSQVAAVEQQKAQLKHTVASIEHSINFNKQSFDKLEEEIAYFSTKENEYETMITEKVLKFSEQEQLASQYKTQLEQLELMGKKYNVLKEMYKNIKYYVFANMVQVLNDNIKKYLDTLFNCSIQVELNTETTNTKGEVKQKFQTEIFKNGVKRSYNSLSGGEKQRVKLATSFAFADVLSSRSTNSLNILFLDEILGEGLDSEGASRVVDLLEKIKQEKNIFIIDHHEYVKVLVDKVIRVEKRNDISQLVI